MKNIKAVIGANFGDEGKGVVTDYLAASGKNGIVVRFNGGAQAGHTVQTKDGKRHVFGHMGSGAFCGLPSYLSAFFVANPMLFMKEFLELKQLGVIPVVYIDGSCMVTTPYDMMINQFAEIFRGASKHGSCGIGFNETITRCLSQGKYRLCVADLKNEDLIREKLYVIKREYAPCRLRDLGIYSIPERYEKLFGNEAIVEGYLQNVRHMLDWVEITDNEIMSSYDSVIFEGAQGLLLDQSHEYFPHVTRSNTGIKNVAELIRQMGYSNEDIEIVYITRAYMTRHGAGPFPTELPEKPYPRIEDRTNVPNPYQDALRYGLLDLDLLSETIKQDMKNGAGLNINPRLAVTCIDQIDGELDYFVGSGREKADPVDFVKKALKELDFKEAYMSYGPTRNTISSVYR